MSHQAQHQSERLPRQQARHGGFDVDLRVQDPTFLEEIDLYSELMIVAAGSSEALSTAAIDQALGLSIAGSAGAPGAANIALPKARVGE